MGVHESPEDQAELDRRRQAVGELGTALRELSEAAVSTEVDADDLLGIAEQVRDLVPSLQKQARGRQQVPSVDSMSEGWRMYSPAIGQGHPFAPPMHVRGTEDGAVGTCTLGLMHEGPHSYGHGGVSALLLDQILGHAHRATKQPGMTVGLSVRYRHPVPLQTPLRIVGHVGDDDPDSRRSRPTATITTEADPDTVLVEAQGTFVVPNPEQLRRLFGVSARRAREQGSDHE